MNKVLDSPPCGGDVLKPQISEMTADKERKENKWGTNEKKENQLE